MTNLKTIAFLLSLLLFNCDNNEELNSVKNLVDGIYITNSESSQVITKWRQPNPPEPIEFEPEMVSDTTNGEVTFGVSKFFEIFPPYPNPSSGKLTVRINFPRRFFARVWIESAGLNTLGVPEFQEFEFLNQELSKVGIYSIIIDEKSVCSGGKLNQGFFRVFAEVDNEYTLWQDIYIGGKRNKAPEGLKNQESVHTCISTN